MHLAGWKNINSGVIYYFCCRYQLFVLKRDVSMGVAKGKFFFSLFLIICFLQAKSQKTVDIGILAGAAAYWGDVEQVDYTKSVTPLFGLIGRYNFNSRIALRGQLLTGRLKAVGIFPGALRPGFANGLSADDSYTFDRSMLNFEAIFEFNFLDYKSGSIKKERFTPFLSLGLGSLYSPYKQKVDFTHILIPITMSPIMPSKILAPSIPMGFGIKYNLTKKLGVCAEMLVRKTFTDKIDYLADPAKYQYPIPNPNIPGTYLDSPEFVPNKFYNNDWFASVNVSLYWQIWTYRGVCKVMDDKSSYYGKKGGY